uniref:Uncharacterized protein n=1 Tax=Rhodnius prolixus TaxID=13249 RepID=T1HUC1_RHOPR
MGAKVQAWTSKALTWLKLLLYSKLNLLESSKCKLQQQSRRSDGNV